MCAGRAGAANPPPAPLKRVRSAPTCRGTACMSPPSPGAACGATTRARGAPKREGGLHVPPRRGFGGAP
eukprot:899808-Pyramimonas_sp.AAC.1